MLAIALLLLIGQSIRVGQFGWTQLLLMLVAILFGLSFRRRAALPAIDITPRAVAAAEPPPVRTLEQQLESIRSAHTNGRAVLWRIDADRELARPWLARGGVFPAPVLLTGDVLGWAASQNVTLRQQSVPEWAESGTTACAIVPVNTASSRALLSLEFRSTDALPEIADLERAAAYLGSLIDLEHERSLGQTQRDKLHAVASMLKRMPEEIEKERFAEQLALFAVQLTHATGAAVSEWDREQGLVLAVATDGDGPRPGLVFTTGESESALAARGGDTLVRLDRPREALPLIAHEESFLERPRSVAALPLAVRNDVIGILTIWTSAADFDLESLSWMETLAPYAALQLRHSRMYGALRERADRDRLTGLYNRQAFDSILAGEVARYQRYLHAFTLLLLDIDHFKGINDRYGHPTGDAVLTNVGRVLTRTLREVDVAARYGGEEFAILLPETELEIGHDIAERVRSAIQASTAHTPGGQINITVSIGITACPACAADADGLIRTADSALYVSKQNGRNQVTEAAVLN